MINSAARSSGSTQSRTFVARRRTQEIIRVAITYEATNSHCQMLWFQEASQNQGFYFKQGNVYILSVCIFYFTVMKTRNTCNWSVINKSDRLSFNWTQLDTGTWSPLLIQTLLQSAIVIKIGTIEELLRTQNYSAINGSTLVLVTKGNPN